MNGLLSLGPERGEALEQELYVFEGISEIEDCGIESRPDLGIAFDEGPEVEPVVPGAHSVTLHEPIRLVALKT